MLNSLKKLDNPLLFVIVLLARHFVKGSEIGDSIAISAVCALYGWCQYLDSKKTVAVNDTIKRDIEELKSSVNGLKIARSITRN